MKIQLKKKYDMVDVLQGPSLLYGLIISIRHDADIKSIEVLIKWMKKQKSLMFLDHRIAASTAHELSYFEAVDRVVIKKVKTEYTAGYRRGQRVTQLT